MAIAGLIRLRNLVYLDIYINEFLRRDRAKNGHHSNTRVKYILWTQSINLEALLYLFNILPFVKVAAKCFRGRTIFSAKTTNNA